MFGYEPTCERVVRVDLRRRDVAITCYKALFPHNEVAFLAIDEYPRWLDRWPGLEKTATISPGGEIVLVRPSEAGEPPDIYSR